MTPTGAHGASALRPDHCFLAPPCLLRSGPTTSDPPAAARASAARLADEDCAASLGRMPAEHHESHPLPGYRPLFRVSALSWERGYFADIGKPIQVTDIAADTAASSAGHVVPVA